MMTRRAARSGSEQQRKSQRHAKQPSSACCEGAARTSRRCAYYFSTAHHAVSMHVHYTRSTQLSFQSHARALSHSGITGVDVPALWLNFLQKHTHRMQQVFSPCASLLRSSAVLRSRYAASAATPPPSECPRQCTRYLYRAAQSSTAHV